MSDSDLDFFSLITKGKLSREGSQGSILDLACCLCYSPICCWERERERESGKEGEMTEGGMGEREGGSQGKRAGGRRRKRESLGK